MLRSRPSYILIVMMLLMMSMSFGFLQVGGVDIGSAVLVNVAWRNISNPSGYRDVAYSVCSNGNLVYVVGSQQSDTVLPLMRIEKRLKHNGTLDGVWVSNSSSIYGELYDCIAVGRYVYAVGYIINDGGSRGFLAVFDEDLVVINKTVWDGWSKIVFIAMLDEYIYIAGLVYTTPGDIGWGIEKLTPNLTPVSRYISNPSTSYDHLLGFSVNPITKDLWVVGLRGDSGAWRVEVLDTSLSEKGKYDYALPGIGMPNSITFDNYGKAYVSGASIAVFNASGGLISITTPLGYCPRIYYSEGLIYLFCTMVIEGVNRLVLYAIDEETFISLVFTIDIDINAGIYVSEGKVYSDDTYIYIPGYTDAYDSGAWFITAIKKIPQTIAIEQEVALPELNTTTIITVNMSLKDIIHSLAQTTVSPLTTTLQIQTSPSYSTSSLQPTLTTSQQPQFPKGLIEIIIVITLIGIGIGLITILRRRT